VAKAQKAKDINCPDLKVGAIDMRGIQGFSHFNKLCITFLD
jgi:hypothetical protein